MAIRERLESEIQDAMRKRDQPRLDALRFLKNGFQQAEIAINKKLDETGLLEVVAKQVKERRESIEMFEQGKRPDLVAKESAALTILETYLPPQLSHDELAQLVKKVITEVGATSIRDKGKVMGKLMPQVKGKADGAEVNQLVTQLLESGA